MRVIEVLKQLQKVNNQIVIEDTLLKELKNKQSQLIEIIENNKLEFKEFINIEKCNILELPTDKKDIEKLINSLEKNDKRFLRETIKIEIEKVLLKNELTNINKSTTKNKLSIQLVSYLKKLGVNLRTSKQVLNYDNIKLTLKD